MINAYVSGFQVFDYHTESAGTEIEEEVQGQNGKRLALIGYSATAAGTAHTLSIMHAGGTRTTVDGKFSSGQKVIDVADAPKDPAGNAIAENDIVAYKTANGTWEFNTVDSLSTKEVTHKANLAATVADGAEYRIFGVVGDGAKFDIAVDASSTVSGYDALYALAPYKGDPLYVSDDNGTHAGSINNLIFGYINK
jgi:hypothetical protein